MNRPSIKILLPLLLACGGAQAVSIPLIHERGTYVVPVLINDKISLKFTVDSGAADVSIPADVFSTLIRAETITKSDLLDKQVYMLADGSEQTSQRFRIRSLRIGDLELRDVTASVAPTAASLLLGQSFLERFRYWTIDNQKHLLIINESPDSGAAKGEMVPPRQTKTPLARGPSLDETMAFVKGQLVEQQAIEYTNHYSSASTNTYTNSFRITYELIPESTCAFKLLVTTRENNDPYSSPSIYKIDLNGLISVSISKNADAEPLNKNPNSGVRVNDVPNITRVTLATTSAYYSYLLFYNGSIAERVARALGHAASLCGGRGNDEANEAFLEP